MDNPKKNVCNTLSFIKNNPGCNTNTLDGHLVDALIDKGWVTGIYARSFGSGRPEYIELRLTIDGEEHLFDLLKGRPLMKGFGVWVSTHVIAKIIVGVSVSLICVLLFRLLTPDATSQKTRNQTGSQLETPKTQPDVKVEPQSNHSSR